MAKHMPKKSTQHGIWPYNDVSPMYVPARNVVFLSLAAAFAQSLGVKTVAIGATYEDYKDFPDCRPQFFTAFEDVTALGMPHKIKVIAPFAKLTKQDIVAMAWDLRVNIHDTISCYRGTGCGECEACVKRDAALAVFERA
jgi:7-cyano-7-deazaguanine synthase